MLPVFALFSNDQRAEKPDIFFALQQPTPMTTTTSSHDTNTTAGNAPAFTPGPWTFRKGRGMVAQHSALIPNAPLCKGSLWSDQVIKLGSTPEDEANARLIAAAPELLAACEAAEYWLTAESERPGQATPDEILRILRAALAKAAAA